MTRSNWLGHLSGGLRRGRRRVLLSGIGILAGVAALTYFLALGEGVREAVLGRLIKDLPAEEIQVSAPTMTVGPVQMNRPGFFGKPKVLDDEMVQKLENLKIAVDGRETKAVSKVYRQLDADFPASISGHLMGVSYGTDTAISGVDPEMVMGDIRVGTFSYNPDADSVPVLVPGALLEVYNSAFARAQDLPQLSESFLFGKHFDMHLGVSSVSSARGGGMIDTRGVIVGITERGTLLGVTVPLEYVREWNKRIGSPDSPAGYRTLTVVANDPAYVADISAKVREMGFEVRSSTGLAERVGSIIALITGGLSLVAGVILFVAALNAWSLFRLTALERRREMGLFMALGATRGEVRSLVLAEAVVVGLIGGIAGLMVAFTSGWATNRILSQVANMPFVPDKIILFNAGTTAMAVLLAVAIALVAAWPAARQLSRLDPAEILS